MTLARERYRRPSGSRSSPMIRLSLPGPLWKRLEFINIVISINCSKRPFLLNANEGSSLLFNKEVLIGKHHRRHHFAESGVRSVSNTPALGSPSCPSDNPATMNCGKSPAGSNEPIPGGRSKSVLIEEVRVVPSGCWERSVPSQDNNTMICQVHSLYAFVGRDLHPEAAAQRYNEQSMMPEKPVWISKKVEHLMKFSVECRHPFNARCLTV